MSTHPSPSIICPTRSTQTISNVGRSPASAWRVPWYPTRCPYAPTAQMPAIDSRHAYRIAIRAPNICAAAISCSKWDTCARSVLHWLPLTLDARPKTAGAGPRTAQASSTSSTSSAANAAVIYRESREESAPVHSRRCGQLLGIWHAAARPRYAWTRRRGRGGILTATADSPANCFREARVVNATWSLIGAGPEHVGVAPSSAAPRAAAAPARLWRHYMPLRCASS